MKIRKKQAVLLALAGVLFLWLASTAQAQTTVRYWDTDGTNPGLGVGGPYDWTLDNLWNTDSTGGAAGVTGGWTDGDTPIFNGNGISTVTISSTINCTNFAVGNAAVDGTAVTLNLSGSGTLNLWGSYWAIGWQAADGTTSSNSAVLNFTGGTINANSTIYIGRYGCSGTLNQTGGSISGLAVVNVGEGGYFPGGTSTANGTLNVSNGLFSPLGGLYLPFASGLAPAYTPTVGTMNIGNGGTAVFGTISVCNTSNTVGTININSGGTLMANIVQRGTYANGATNNATAIINFNGGVFQGRRSANPTIGRNGNASAALDAIYVRSGGAIFNTASFSLYITDPLLDGGGGGGLTKTNTGNLELDNTNTYTGGTTVEMGTLNLGVNGFVGVNGAIDNSAFINLYPGTKLYVGGRTDDSLYLQPGQILEGSGLFQGILISTNGGIVAPGHSWAPSTMSLQLQGDATIQSTIVMDLNRGNATNCDQLLNNGYNFHFGGSLIVNNIGASLVSGDTFTLFNSTLGSGAYGGSFSSITLPTLPSSLVWVTTNLYVNGSIKVVNAPPPPVFAGVDYSQVANGIIGFNATNGTPGGAYMLLSSTNLNTPFSSWLTVTNGNFDVNGDLNGLYISNIVGSPQFFILKQ